VTACPILRGVQGRALVLSRTSARSSPVSPSEGGGWPTVLGTRWCDAGSLVSSEFKYVTTHGQFVGKFASEGDGRVLSQLQDAWCFCIPFLIHSGLFEHLE